MTMGRLLPLAILLGFAGAAFAFGVDKYFTLDALRANRVALIELVGANPVAGGLAFVATYTAVVAFSLPGATVMTVAGGFLFGVPIGTSLAILGATVGATILFLVGRSALGEVVRRQAGPFLGRMTQGFSKNAFSYLLFLRLVPAFPFWAVNLAAALLGMRLVPFIVATGLGIIPGSAIFATFGAGLGQIFDSGGEVSVRGVLSPELIAGLVGLGVLALLPIALKRWRAE